MQEMLINALGMIAWSIILGSAALLLLGEYGRLLLKRPKAVLTMEAWSELLANCGGPGYLACVLICCAAIFLFSGVTLIIVATASSIGLI